LSEYILSWNRSPVSDISSRRALRSSATCKFQDPLAITSTKARQHRAFSIVGLTIGQTIWNVLSLKMPKSNANTLYKLFKTNYLQCLALTWSTSVLVYWNSALQTLG